MLLQFKSVQLSFLALPDIAQAKTWTYTVKTAHAVVNCAFVPTEYLPAE